MLGYSIEGSEEMSETDWRRVPCVVTNGFQIEASSESVRLVCGHGVDKDEYSFHTGLMMSRADAEALCQLMQDLLRKTAAGAPGTTASSGTHH